ncbi:porin [Pseudomonas abieticivorans]|uniref:porin n=1 Tax=Pseudomonas abieticivorans TaxID=2931382 RepID=UPI0020BE9692|nr:porin [Pseudomonas sp. PIA16]
MPNYLDGAAARLAVLIGLSGACTQAFAQPPSLEAMAQLLQAQQQQIAEQSRLLQQLQHDLAQTRAQQNAADTREVVAQTQQQAEQKTKADALKMAPPGSLSFSPAADTVFTLYGGADMGLFFQRNNGGPNLTYKPNRSNYLGFMGNAEGSPNLGFRALYKLRDGWTAGLDASGGVTYSGTTSTTYSPFNKTFNLQLGSPYGKLIVGEQYDPAWLASVRGDPRDGKQTYDALAAAWSFGQGTGTPQSNFNPTNAFGYQLNIGALSIGLLYKPSTNANATASVPFDDNHSVGQQQSLGLVYDDGKWLLSAAYLQKWGSTTAVHGRDVRNWTLGVGRHIGDVLVRAGVSDVDLPYGVRGSPLGTATSPWPNITDAQEILMGYAGAKWNLNPANVMDLTYSYSYDRLNHQNNTQMLVLGNDYSITRNLTFFVSGALIKAGDQANPLTASTSPGNVAAPGTLSFSSSTGLRLRF